jgi:2-dehydropantoate 2-reductase
MGQLIHRFSDRREISIVRIAVFGAGGLGGYFGARFAQAGESVHLIARGAHLAALRERGLTVHSGSGDLHVKLPATDDPTQIGAVDVVLFSVKSYDTDASAARLGPLLGLASAHRDATAVVSFQNGIDNEERIAAAIGEQHVVGGVCYIFASIAEPGVIEYVGGPARLVFGELDGQRTRRIEAFLAACRRASVDAEITDDIRAALWSKYVFLCALAGMTAAVRLPVGELRVDPSARAMLRALIEEGTRVARAEGVGLPGDYVERQMAFIDKLDPRGLSSLHHDLVTGHRMELEALHGELLRRAARAGVDLPASRAAYAILSPWARRNWMPPAAPLGTPRPDA